MKNIMPWIEIFVGLANIRTQYEEIKKNEDAKATSKVLGWKAIRYDIWLIVFTVIALSLGAWGAQYLNNVGLIVGIVAIIIAIVFAIYIPVFLLFALSASIKQVKLNHKPIGIIALVLTLLLTTAAVVSVVLIVQKFN